jgi:LPS sulfotransferase NodH
MQENPLMFLEKEVFRPYPKDMKAIGFKIFYYHAQTDNRKCVWTYQQNQSDLKVLHLKRKNILKTHLSRKRADKSGKWINLTDERENIESITLSYDECLDDFTSTRRWEEQYDALFEHHSRLEVFYENLSNDSDAELQRIQKFLGVQEEELKSMTYRQNDQPISQTIANYCELKERFKDTSWAEFFEE